MSNPALMGKPVQHKHFGRGTIVGVGDDTVSINFQGERGRGFTRKFLLTALFDDEHFPKEQNAEAWATRKPQGPGRQA